MLADFTINIHIAGQPDRSVRVVVHDNLRALRSAATRYHNSWKSTKDEPPSDRLLGVCHRFELAQNPNSENKVADPLCAVVRLAPPYLGVGMVSHELAHAAVWIRELEVGENQPLNCQNDEDFCWVLGELVRQTVVKFIEKGIYPNDEEREP